MGSWSLAPLKLFIDSRAPDGDAGRFPIERLAEIQERALAAGIVWLLLAVLLAVLRPSLLGVAAAPWVSLLAGVRRTGAELMSFARRERLHFYLRLALTLYFAVVAIAMLAQPRPSPRRLLGLVQAVICG